MTTNRIATNLDDVPKPDLSQGALDELAELALRLAQKDAEKQGVRPPRAFIPYREQQPEARANQRAGVYRVVQALVLLGYIDTPK
jgi:predicted GNAT superfamily acetyltransferase